MNQSQQPQQFHTSNYRGDQPGHDSYLRSDSQSPSSFNSNQNVNSQYKGLQRNFQPTGPVNSVYGQAQGQQVQNQMGGYNQTGSTQMNNSYGSYNSNNAGAGTQSYHTANYHGNQPGHDNYLRADSTQPSQTSGYGTSMNQQASFTPAYGSFNAAVSSNYNQNQNQNQFVSPNSFHTANYRGDQAGHDNYLRSDSQQPAQSQYGVGTSGASYGNTTASNFNNLNTNTGASNYGTNNTQQNQFVSPNTFHTANYRGDQAGHDNYLRSDSQQTAQSQTQYGVGANTGGFKTNKF